VVTIDRFRFKVLNAESWRIYLLQVTERRASPVEATSAVAGE